MLYVGIMSGTSLDGIDAVLVEIDKRSDQLQLNTLAFSSLNFPEKLRLELQTLQKPCEDELHRSFLAAGLLAQCYAQATHAVLVKASKNSADVSAIGAHGQTIRHRPEHHYSVQLLNGALLAELTGIDVACDFRSADLAAQGQGAPLAPGFHAEVFSHSVYSRGIVNIGGIANLTILQPGALAPTGFDTGPGNTLMDYWCGVHTGQAFDRDGAWANSAQPNPQLLESLLADPYFVIRGPKSTGRDWFNPDWLNRLLKDFSTIDANVVQATLLELTAKTISKEIMAAGIQEVYLCGGGAFNKALFRRLSTLISPTHLYNTTKLGIDPQSVEALAFAWLAYKRVHLQAANLPSVTAAKGLRILGALHKTGTI